MKWILRISTMLIHVERETLSVHIVVCTRIVANIDFRFSYYPRRTLVKPHPTKYRWSPPAAYGMFTHKNNRWQIVLLSSLSCAIDSSPFFFLEALQYAKRMAVHIKLSPPSCSRIKLYGIRFSAALCTFICPSFIAVPHLNSHNHHCCCCHFDDLYNMLVYT